MSSFLSLNWIYSCCRLGFQFLHCLFYQAWPSSIVLIILLQVKLNLYTFFIRFLLVFFLFFFCFFIKLQSSHTEFSYFCSFWLISLLIILIFLTYFYSARNNKKQIYFSNILILTEGRRGYPYHPHYLLIFFKPFHRLFSILFFFFTLSCGLYQSLLYVNCSLNFGKLDYVSFLLFCQVPERLPNTTGLLNELLECFFDSIQNFTISRISLFLTGIVLERDISLFDSDISMQARNWLKKKEIQ